LPSTAEKDGEMPTNTSPVLGHAGASEYLARQHGVCRAAATIAKYACRGVPGGVERPRFRKAGRDVLYDPAEFDAFAARLIREPADQVDVGRNAAARAGNDDGRRTSAALAAAAYRSRG
jgi:hypothetical protein